MKLENQVKTIALVLAFSTAAIALTGIQTNNEERKLCQAYIDANLGWVKENAAVDEHGLYRFKHPNGNNCLISPTAP